MHHQSIRPAELAPPGAILALRIEMAAAGLANASPFDRAIFEALDREYGEGNWALFWDEDLAGRPIRGSISVAYGAETLVIG